MNHIIKYLALNTDAFFKLYYYGEEGDGMWCARIEHDEMFENDRLCEGPTPEDAIASLELELMK